MVQARQSVGVVVWQMPCSDQPVPAPTRPSSSPLRMITVSLERASFLTSLFIIRSSYKRCPRNYYEDDHKRLPHARFWPFGALVLMKELFERSLLDEREP